MTEIRDAIKKFKEENGNISFKTKDLVIAIYQELREQRRDITDNKAGIAFNKGTNAVLIGIIIGIVLKIFVF